MLGRILLDISMASLLELNIVKYVLCTYSNISPIGCFLGTDKNYPLINRFSLLLDKNVNCRQNVVITINNKE